MKKIACLPLIAALLASPSLAAPACYTPEEVEAEQGLHFRTQLMVAGHTCHRLMPELDPLGVYGRFTLRNGDVIVDYQNVLLRHFRRQGGNAERQFDRHLIKLANAESMRSSTLPNIEYCQTKAELFRQADSLSKKAYRDLSSQLATVRRGDYRLCPKKG